MLGAQCGSLRCLDRQKKARASLAEIQKAAGAAGLCLARRSMHFAKEQEPEATALAADDGGSGSGDDGSALEGGAAPKGVAGVGGAGGGSAQPDDKGSGQVRAAPLTFSRADESALALVVQARRNPGCPQGHQGGVGPSTCSHDKQEWRGCGVYMCVCVGGVVCGEGRAQHESGHTQSCHAGLNVAPLDTYVRGAMYSSRVGGSSRKKSDTWFPPRTQVRTLHKSDATMNITLTGDARTRSSVFSCSVFHWENRSLQRGRSQG